jgi:hypothetical protein
MLAFCGFEALPTLSDRRAQDGGGVYGFVMLRSPADKIRGKRCSD